MTKSKGTRVIWRLAQKKVLFCGIARPVVCFVWVAALLLGGRGYLSSTQLIDDVQEIVTPMHCGWVDLSAVVLSHSIC